MLTVLSPVLASEWCCWVSHIRLVALCEPDSATSSRRRLSVAERIYVAVLLFGMRDMRLIGVKRTQSWRRMSRICVRDLATGLKGNGIYAPRLDVALVGNEAAFSAA